MNLHEIHTRPESLRDLFEGHRDLRAVIDGVLEGVLGRVFVDAPHEPRAARLSVGVYEVLGGDPGLGAGLIASVPHPCELVIPLLDPGWLASARALFGAELQERSMRTFDASSIEPEHLAALVADVPDGYELLHLTADLARRLGPSLSPNRIANFGDADSFVERGFGCCALADGEIACAASTYALSSSGAEIAIATEPAHRRRGLAVLVGAEMVRMCLERGHVPVWTAANDASTRVALRLGFEVSGACRIHDLAAPDRR